MKLDPRDGSVGPAVVRKESTEVFGFCPERGRVWGNTGDGIDENGLLALTSFL